MHIYDREGEIRKQARRAMVLDLCISTGCLIAVMAAFTAIHWYCNGGN